MATPVKLPLPLPLYEVAMAAADKAVPEGCTCRSDDDACPWHQAYMDLVEAWRAVRRRTEGQPLEAPLKEAA